MFRKLLLWICILSLCVLLVACVKTPNTAPVIGFDEESIFKEKNINLTDETVVEESACFEWEDIYVPYDNTVFNINVKFANEHNNAFSIYKYTCSSFTLDSVRTCIQYLINEPVGIRENEKTKDDIYEELLRAYRGHIEYNSEEPTYAPYDGQEEEIERLQKELENAPNEKYSQYLITDMAFPMDDVIKTQSGVRWWVYADSNHMRLAMHNNIIQVESVVKEGNAYPGEPVGTTINNVKISDKDAIRIGNKMIANLGLPNLQIARAEKARIIDKSNNILSEGWYLIYTHNDGNRTPLVHADALDSYLQYDGTEHVDRLNNEIIYMLVDKEGIRHFEWYYPCNQEDVINDNPETISFEKLRERTLFAIKTGISWIATHNPDVQFTCDINNIKLSNCVYPIKNGDGQEFYMIPIWVFDLNQCIDGSYTQTGILCINALDGSFIDPVYITK